MCVSPGYKQAQRRYGIQVPLARTHATLDRAVDRCCRPQPFATELARLEFLFGLYQQLSAPVLGAAPKAKARPRTTAWPDHSVSSIWR